MRASVVTVGPGVRSYLHLQGFDKDIQSCCCAIVLFQVLWMQHWGQKKSETPFLMYACEVWGSGMGSQTGHSIGSQTYTMLVAMSAREKN